MNRIVTGFGTAVGIALALLAGVASPARAQVAQGPLSVYAGQYPGGGFYDTNPYGSYLRGAAEVIRAQGLFLIQEQEAYKLYQDYRAAKIEVRRKQLEQWLWERENLPT